MKKIISVLIIITIIMSITNIYADYPSDYFPPEPNISNTLYPYRLIFKNMDGAWVYLASKYKLDCSKFMNSQYPTFWEIQRGSEAYNYCYYTLSMNNNVTTWTNYGTDATSPFQRPIFTLPDIAFLKYVNYDVYGYELLDSKITKDYHLIKANSNSSSSGSSGSENDTPGVYNSYIDFINPDENDNYCDNTYIMTFLVEYRISLPSDIVYDKRKLELSVTGGVAGTGEATHYNFDINNNKILALLKFTRQLYPGENTITLTIKYDGVLLTSKSIKVTYFEDFVDDNADGLDDRTGNTEIPDDWMQTIPDNTPDGTVLGYIKWGFENITYLFEGVVGIVEGLFSMTGKMSTIIGSFMGGLPTPVTTCLILGTMICVVLKILGR